MTKFLKRISCIMAVLFVCSSFFMSCNIAKADPLSYMEILKNSLDQSKETVLKQCGFNEENLQKDKGDREDEVWYPEEKSSIAGYDADIRLDFRSIDDCLGMVTYTMEFQGDEAYESGYQAMLAVYDELCKAWGESGLEGVEEPEIPPKETFGDYESFYQYLLSCEEGYGWSESWGWPLYDYGEDYYGSLTAIAAVDYGMRVEVRVRHFMIIR